MSANAVNRLQQETRFKAAMRHWRWAALALSAVMALLTGFKIPDAATAEAAVRYGGYAFMLGTVVLWCRTLWKCWRTDRAGHAMAEASGAMSGWRERLKHGAKLAARPLVLLVVLGTALSWVSESGGYKILYDEYVLQGTALQMHRTREMHTVLRAYEIDGGWVPLNSYLDKRPNFFPFLLCTLHDLTGYREANAQVLNLGLTALLLACTYALTKRLTGSATAGLAAGWLLAGLPLLAQNTNGSGMDLLNVVMIALCALLALRLCARVDDERQDAFLLGCILLAQSRYESALYVGAAFGVLAYVWWRNGVRLTVVTLLAPLLLLPVAWQNIVLNHNEFLWQLPAELHERFSSEHLAGNISHAFSYLFSWNQKQSNSVLLSSLGVVGVAGLLALTMARRGRPLLSDKGWVAFCFMTVVAANMWLLMHYYWGELDDPLVSRLSLPLLLVFAVVAAASAVWLETRVCRPIPLWLVCVAIFSLPVTYGRLTPLHWYSQGNLIEKEIDWERRWVLSQPPARRIVLTNKSCLPWLLRDIPSLQIEQVATRAEAVRFQLDAGYYDEILVMQRMRASTVDGDFEIEPEDRLPDEFITKELAMRRVGPNLAVISRIIGHREGRVALLPSAENAQPTRTP